MAAQRIYATARAPHVPEQQLQDCSSADDLRTEGMLRPAHGVHNRGDLLQVSVFANGSKQVGRFQELIFLDARYAFNHFRRVARVLLLQQLVDATRMLQSQIVSYL